MLSKNQIKTIILLNCILVIVMLGYFINNRFFIVHQTASPHENIYNTQRDANISLNPYISLETNIGGSGDEKLIKTFFCESEEKLHIFLMSNSSDYDLSNKQGHIVMAILDKQGKTEKFITYGEKEDNLFCVNIANNGYLLCIDGKSPKLLHINYKGEIIRLIRLDKFNTCKFTNVQVLDNEYLISLEYSTSVLGTKQLKIIKTDLSLNINYERTITSPYSLTFLNIYQLKDKLILCTHASSDLTSCLAFIEIGYPENYKITYIDDIWYTPLCVLPTPNGYVANVLIDNNNLLFLFDINFKKIGEIKLNNAINSQIFYVSNNYYIFSSGIKNSMTAFNSSFTIQKELDDYEENTKLTDIKIYNNYALACFNSNKGINVSTINSGKYSINFGYNESNGQIAPTDNGYFVVMESDSNSTEITHNFGKKDIGIVFINYQSS